MKMWVVGAGYWGSKLLEALSKLEVEAKVIDIRNGQTIEQIDTMDPVILATPLWNHYEQTCKLLTRGHDVYVEKPMAQTLSEISHIEQLVKNDQLLMVGHLFVHHPQMNQIKQILSDQTIGKLIHITSRRLNWGIYQTKTDPLLSLATHDVSIIHEIVNDTATVENVRTWQYSNNTQPDRVWFAGQCAGVGYDIDVSWCWPHRTRQTVLIGTDGQIVWDQDANTVTVAHNLIQNNRAVPDPHPKVSVYDYVQSPLEVELRHWVDCVRWRQSPITGVVAAKAVAKVIDQAKQLF